MAALYVAGGSGDTVRSCEHVKASKSPLYYFTNASRTLITKASKNKKTISGIFQRMSLLKTVPQFQHARSLLGTIRRHVPQGRRGAVVSRPHEPQNCAAACAPQNGHARPGICAAMWPPAGDCLCSKLISASRQAGLPVRAASIAIPCSRLPGIPMRWNLATNGFAGSRTLMCVNSPPVEAFTGGRLFSGYSNIS